MIRILLTCICCSLLLNACKNATAHSDEKKQLTEALVKKESITHQDIQPAEICGLSGQEVLYLDVRTPEEFNGTAAEKFGAIKDAINIPVQELEKRIKELDAFRHKKIVVYCSLSHRSPRACYLLTKSGFTGITNMLGGMSVWKEQVRDAGCSQNFYQNQQ